MKRLAVAGLLASLAGGFLVGRQGTPPEPSLVDEDPVDANWEPAGASGPGLSCPAAESLSCQPEPSPQLSAAPMARVLREAPNCSGRPIAGNWIFNAAGEPAQVPPGSDRSGSRGTTVGR